MDQTGATLVKAVEPYGLGPLLFVGFFIVAIFVACAFVLPTWKTHLERADNRLDKETEARIALESEREKRKAQESEQTAKMAVERARIDSESNVLMEGMKASIDSLNASVNSVVSRFDEAGSRSARMGNMVEDTNRKVSDIYREFIDTSRHGR